LFRPNLLRFHRGRPVPVFLKHYGCNEAGERVERSKAGAVGSACCA
jgi:hypothetical protein